MKFVAAIAVLFAAVAWLGMSGFEDGKAYFKTADEFVKMSPGEQSRRIRLMGDAQDVDLGAATLTFNVVLNGASVPVVYHGKDPVPDTFKEGASVLVEGSIGADGRFVGKTIQAKCASKYEADPTEAYSKAADAARS